MEGIIMHPHALLADLLQLQAVDLCVNLLSSDGYG